MRAYFKLLYAFFCIIFAITLRLIELSIVENFKIWATNWICHPFLSRFPYWLNRNVFFCSRSYAKIWGIISNRFSWSLSSCNFFAFEREPGARCLCICFWLGELLQDDALSRSDFCSFLSCVCLDLNRVSFSMLFLVCGLFPWLSEFYVSCFFFIFFFKLWWNVKVESLDLCFSYSEFSS